MNTKTHIAVVLVIILSLLSCKKDKTPTASSDCYEFDYQEISIIYDYVLSGKQYMAPCFNPNNPNELVYYFRDYENGTTQLKKYNLSTGQQTVIVDNPGRIYGQPKWGKNGWIAYTHSAGYVDHIYIVKDNGDSLRQFTNNVANLDPVWSDTDIELYWVHSPDLGSNWYFFRQRLDENQPDTLSTDRFSLTDILNNKLLLRRNIEPAGYYGALTYYGFYDLNMISSLNANNFTTITEHAGSLSGLCWSYNNQFFYSTLLQDGLYKVNAISGQKNQLISFCDSKRYEIISCSSDGKYLVAERVDSKENHEEGKIYETHTISLIELATMKETAVDLE